MDPPLVLFQKGQYLPQDRLAVAIVGSRQCTLYGRQTAEKLARSLAMAGVTIVSGMARGIDAAAHRGALEVGGRTIAVWGTGLAETYPPEHVGLAEEISKHGALFTESPADRGPSRGIFPQRNRIISAISLGVILVEAGRTSGSLHTARHALEQGRDVFAVPGRIDSLTSQGCHDLIRDGVPLIRGADDVLQVLGPMTSPTVSASGAAVHTPRELTLSDFERSLLNLVTLDQRHQDEIIRESGLEASQVVSTLLVLEMRRLIRRLPGGYFARVPY